MSYDGLVQSLLLFLYYVLRGPGSMLTIVSLVCLTMAWFKVDYCFSIMSYDGLVQS
jgi:hypothetical protein